MVDGTAVRCGCVESNRSRVIAGNYRMISQRHGVVCTR
jgi:hypothetical protein